MRPLFFPGDGKCFFVSPPKRPFSFWDHDTVKNILWQMVAGYSSISATHDKTILHGGVWLLCFLFLPVLCIVNSISVPVVASEYHTCTMPWRASPCSDLSGLYFLSAALLFRRLTPPVPSPFILTEWDVIATIGLYNSVHKSSLCECTFDKVYLFICKHLIINRQYI